MVAAFSESMAADGFEDIVNIDISNVVIEEMKKKYTNHPNLKCILDSISFLFTCF